MTAKTEDTERVVGVGRGRRIRHTLRRNGTRRHHSHPVRRGRRQPLPYLAAGLLALPRHRRTTLARRVTGGRRRRRVADPDVVKVGRFPKFPACRNSVYQNVNTAADR